MSIYIKIVIAGLCSLLNVEGTSVDLPKPSVMVVRTGQKFAQTMPHVPFIAWDGDKVSYVAGDLGNLTVETIQYDDNKPSRFKYVKLDGYLIEVGGEAVLGAPNTDEYQGVASYYKYARNRATDWDSCYIPELQAYLPDRRCVAGFMYFLDRGKLTTDRFTPFPIEFRDSSGATTQPDSYAREVHYTFEYKKEEHNNSEYPTVTFVIARLEDKNIEVGKLTLTSNAKEDLEVFLANAAERYMFDLVNRTADDPETAVAQYHHFRALGAMVKNWDIHGMPIPAHVDFCEADQSHDGAAGDPGGYCGPDGKP